MKKIIGMLAVAVNLGVGLACIALGLLGWIAGGDMYLPLVPVEPDKVATALVSAGTFAVVAAVLAARGGRLLRLLMLIWSTALVGVLGSGVFRSDFRFDGLAGLTQYGWIFFGAVVLLFASWLRYSMARKSSTGSRRHTSPRP